MADDELEAIRRQRMAELQAKHGVRNAHELKWARFKMGC